jgi:hypothetical protein
MWERVLAVRSHHRGHLDKAIPAAAITWLRPRSQLLGVAIWALIVVGLATPAVFLRPDVGLDSSWQVALQMASRRAMQWGKEIVWTYGPYGYLDQPIYAYFRTWLAAAVAGIAMHLVLCTALGLLLWRSHISGFGWLLSAAILILPLDINLEYQTLLAAVLLLYLSLDADKKWVSYVAAAVAGLVLALLSLVKGTGLLSAGALTMVFVVFCLVIRRASTALALVVAIAVSFAALWRIAGQSMVGVPAYLWTTYELASGYSAAMSYTTHTLEPLGHGIPGAIILGLVTLVAVVATLRGDLSVMRIGWLALPLTFIGFKEGFVRGDIIHQLRFYSEAILLWSPVLLLALRRRAWLESVMSAVTVIIAIGAVFVGVRLEPPTLPPAWHAQSVVDRLSTYPEAALLLIEPEEGQKQSAAAAAQMRATYQLPPSIVTKLREGTADVVPFELDIAYAYDLRWVPRPVFQTYQAYTPALDRLNADHFSRSNAPDRVLFSLTAIDNRYPMFEEPETTWVLLHRYHVEEINGPNIVLARDAQDFSQATQPVLKEARTQLGRSVGVPQVGGDVRASIHLSYSLRGQLRSLLYRPSGLYVRFLYANGQQSPEYRLIHATAVDWVPLGWYLADSRALEDYLGGHPTYRIQAIVVRADNPSDYAPAYDVSFQVTSDLTRPKTQLEHQRA